jgi:hypothetical protein
VTSRVCDITIQNEHRDIAGEKALPCLCHLYIEKDLEFFSASKPNGKDNPISLHVEIVSLAAWSRHQWDPRISRVGCVPYQLPRHGASAPNHQQPSLLNNFLEKISSLFQ